MGQGKTHWWGLAFIAFAVGFNIPYAWLASHFNYPDILREPAGTILQSFHAGGAPLILAWGAFALAALLFAPVAVGMAVVTRREGHAASAIAGLGIAAGVTQAIGLSRWVYAVPGLAAAWTAGADGSSEQLMAAQVFGALHQFAGVGVGEAIGQTLTGLWLIGVANGQRGHAGFGRAVGWLGMVGGVILLTGCAEGLATVLAFDPGIFGFSALVGFLVLSAWLVWTGILSITGSRRIGAGG